MIGQDADEHDGAGHRQRHAEHQAGRPGPAEGLCEPDAEQGGDRALGQRAGNGDAAHRQQLVEVELQADAEHQQDHADLGELLGQRGVGDEARACAGRRACRPAE